VPAVMFAGVVKLSCCQPVLDSLENVPVASSVPLVDHRLPMWVPVFAVAL
jgi:hypothetical protein